MLKKLKLQNLALIEIIEINFEKGLNVFTGESGSGKSLILDSLNSLFGGTNIPINHLIRPDKNECQIEGIFECSKKIKDWLIIKGYKNLTKELFVTRKILRNNGKVSSIYYLNSQKINKNFVKLLGQQLIDFAGQSDASFFGSQEYLRKIINELGSSELQSINRQVKNKWHDLSLLKEEIAYISDQIFKEEENHFAISKILKILEAANLSSKDEILELKSQELRLSNNSALNDAIKNTLLNLNALTNESVSVNSLVFASIKELSRVSKFDQLIEKYIEKLLLIQNQTEDIILSLSEYLKFVEADDTQLEVVQKRLFELQNLEKTFSLELPELIKKRDNLRNDNHFESKKNVLSELQNKYIHLNSQFEEILLIQSSLRKEIAVNLEKNVTLTLKQLGLENAIFKIQFKSSDPNSEGKDNINFLFSANPDQPLLPISKVISGGEMSRFLLALKSNITYAPDTLFFDEIDNGLSGKSLNSLLKLIKNISKEKQLLCITHQPLLAASTKSHFKVEKQLLEGKTFTKVTKLVTKCERQNQLAELMGVSFNDLDNYALKLFNQSAA